jgi:succinate dehydrogenase/fumarate reductase flavoprotein subunit
LRWGSAAGAEATTEWKHLRVGIDMRAAEAQGLAALLIAEGRVHPRRVRGDMRLAMNEELARYEEHCRAEYGLPDIASFR